MARKPRGRRKALLLLILVALALLWGGQRPGGSSPDATASDAAPRRLAHLGPATSERLARSDDAQRTAAPLDAIVEDRLSGNLRRCADALEVGALGVAAGALGDAHALAAGGGESRVAAAEERLDAAIEARVRAALDAAAAGRILEARGLLADVLPLERAREPLGAAAAAAGWPRLPARLAPEVGDLSPAPLRRDRAVRYADGGSLVPARAAGVAGKAALSLEVVREGRVYYPVVPRTAVEPVDATPAEALAQCEAAILARDAPLAALWLGLARARGAGAERSASIARLLGVD